MTNEKPKTQIYEQLTEQGETAKWFARFLVYRNMGASRRSLLGAANENLELDLVYKISASDASYEQKVALLQDEAIKSQLKPYKNVPGAWKKAFEKWNWKERAEAYDAKLQAEQEERARVLREFEAAEIERIMTTGYAAVHERVKGLDEMAQLIKKSWLNDEGEIVYQWLSPDKVREYRGCLDDIAKELGQRVKTEKRELSGSIEFKTEWGGGSLDTDDIA